MTRPYNRLLVAGDIGGTKTILALFNLRQEAAPPLVSETCESRKFSSLESMIDAFLSEHPARPACAAFAVAGPIRDGAAQVTNLPWSIDAAAIEERFEIPEVFLLNDVEAFAWAVPLLSESELHALTTGQPTPHGTIAVVAPGTGCGEAFLVWDGARYVARPSEGGHADFAPSGEAQTDLLRYLQRQFKHVSVERVCSGTGLHNIYRFLRDQLGISEERRLADRLGRATDPAPVISEAALTGESQLCVETLRMFVSILGAEAGNLALKVLATGGVYLGGGIPPQILPFLETSDFRDAFTSKGRFAFLMRDVPTYVVMDPQAVLRGAARRGAEDRACRSQARRTAS